MKSQSVIKGLTTLDFWADQTIKHSFIGKSLILVIERVSQLTTPLFSRFNNKLFILLLISICGILTSLSMPQFASDRFGVGLIIIFSFLFFLFYLFSGKNLKISFNSIDCCIVMFLALAVISSFSSYFFKESLIGLSKYIVFLLWYLMIKTTFANCSKKAFLNLWGFFCIVAVITASIGIYQNIIGVEPLATWEDPTQETIHTRVYSTLGNPNLLAGYLLAILPICAILAVEYKNNLLKIFFTGGSILILVCLIQTGSRGGYIGLLVAFILSIIVCLNYFIFQQNTNKTKNLLLAIFGIIALILFLTFLFPVITERLLTIFTLREHSSNNYRVNVWIACLQMLKDNLFVGIGPGNSTFRLAYGLYMVTGFDALAAYNVFLEIAVEIGILGSFIFILIFLLSFLKLHYLFWDKKSLFSLGIFISLIGLLTHGMVDTVFFRPQIFIPFWLLLASIGKIEGEVQN